jgi:hypothetical protein
MNLRTSRPIRILSSEKPRLPVDRFGITNLDEHKIRMSRVEDNVAFPATRDNTRYPKDCGSVLLKEAHLSQPLI